MLCRFLAAGFAVVATPRRGGSVSMNAKYPLVSAIMPAYNAEKYISQTLESVIAQTYRNLEIIVVDDGSRDTTPDIVKAAAARDSRIKFIRQRNQGVAVARNTAIEHASGEYIAPVDADDIWYEEKIKKQMRCMAASPAKVGVVYSWSTAMAEDGALYGAASCAKHEGDVFTTMIYQNFIGNASVPLIRRACIDHVGGYDPNLRAQNAEGCEDWDLTLRLAEHYHYAVTPEFLVGYRQLNNSMSTNTQAMARSYFLVLDQFRRRRPDIPAYVFRWSASHFCQYLMWKAYLAGDIRGTLNWIFRGIAADPAVLIAPMAFRFLSRSLARLAAQPLTSAIWPSREDWLNWKMRVFKQRCPKRTLSEVIRECGRPRLWLHPYYLLARLRMSQVMACCPRKVDGEF